MPKLKTRRKERYERLRERGFLPGEALRLSKISHRTPALAVLIATREAFQKRFDKKADREDWGKTQYNEEYRKAIKRLYRRHGWTVQEGPTGRQRGPAKGKSSVWHMYRDYERKNPTPHALSSPWTKKKHRKPASISPSDFFNYQQWQAERKKKSRRQVRQYK